MDGQEFGHNDKQREQPLAQGKEYHSSSQGNEYPEGDEYDAVEGMEGSEGERGIIGDTYRKFRGKSPKKPGEDPSLGSFIFGKLQGAVQDISSEIGKRMDGRNQHSNVNAAVQAYDSMPTSTSHRYGSFATQRTGSDAKWFVDGCGYFWAVSEALEHATQSIWILDWWLSPELYLRRPPSSNENYRLDRLLRAAAQRGVKINIIVYKEVEQALTRKYLSPTLPEYLHSLLPRSVDTIAKDLTRVGLAATFVFLQHLEKANPLIPPPVTVDSAHTKHALEALHPNISVFRHPDHLPDAQTLESSLWSSLKNIDLSARTASTLPEDALKAIYGMNNDVVLFWAHHEKLCLIDGKTAFMGGLDLCYGRWDTNQHPIADCHPTNLNDIVFPGQDYNNARIMDFQDVSHWQNNKVDRTKSSRMGWSDISISLRGPVVRDLCVHFMERWNFIYKEKYDVRQEARYTPLTLLQGTYDATVPTYPPPPSHGYQQYQPPSSSGGNGSSQLSTGVSHYPPPPPGPPPSTQSYGHNAPQASVAAAGVPPPPMGSGHYSAPPPGPLLSSDMSGSSPPLSFRPQEQSQSQTPYFPPPPPSSSRDIGGEPGERSHNPSSSHHPRMERYEEEAESLPNKFRARFEQGKQHLQEQYLGSDEHRGVLGGRFQEVGLSCQIVRSCTKWSHGVDTEHSVANAYISVIENSLHFVYIENQFFITATSDAQQPVKNKIGAAIVDRILRAARAGQKYKIIVVMPAVPGFAGDLKDESALGTRAIMEFQYNSINRGGCSIMEMIGNAGYDPTEYIRFYNLRNYDRINVGAPMREAEQKSGVSYQDARNEHDQAVELPADMPGVPYTKHPNYQAYSEATGQMNKQEALYAGKWDSVSECYMLGGRDIRSVPWENGDVLEIDAFVSEELYIHSKVLIADDRVAIVGSANLNDRSQLGSHDSEIAIIVEDPTPVDSYMDGRHYRASKFAATLRRQLFRKHLGLLAPQDMQRPDQNFEPIGTPNVYDYGSPEDLAVIDPLANTFLALWNSRARTNTLVFSKVFHPVPDDSVLTWADYDKFYEHFFKGADLTAEGKASNTRASKYMWGHVVADEFSPGEQGVREVKDLLSTVKGTLVEMPLLFLIKEDIAQEGLSLNAFTKTVYT